MAIQPKQQTPKLVAAEPGKSAEDKAARFSRLASARVTSAVRAIRRVGALAAPQYERASQVQLGKIESHLTNEVRSILRLPAFHTRPLPPYAQRAPAKRPREPEVRGARAPRLPP